jgi:GNAT superfamily N-acetyltransferase
MTDHQPDLPEPRVAMLQDKDLFRRLCMKLLEEQAASGDIVLANEYNLGLYVKIFELYAMGELDGHTLLIGDFAMVMHGETLGGFEMKPGKCAYLWCLYVEPEYRSRGVSSKFHKLGMKRLLAQGFKFTMFQTLANNENVYRALHGAVEGKQGAGTANAYTNSMWWPLEGVA